MKIFYLQLSLVFYFLIVFNLNCYSQFKSHINLIINDVKYKNGNLIVKFEITNATTNDNIRVWIDVFNSKKDTIHAKSWKGDVNKFIEGGGEKVAIWNVFNDQINLMDSITVKVSATLENRFYLDDPLILSTIYPGWGDYKIRPRNPYWVYGVLGYGLLGASAETFYSATNNYNKYLNSTSIKDKNEHYEKAMLNKNLTYAFLGAAGVVWILDYFGVIKRKSEIQKSWKKSMPLKENPNNPSFKITSAISDKEFVNTSLTSLQLVQGSLRYVDNDENLCLDAFEEGYVEFKLINHGPVRAKDFYAKIKRSDNLNEISFPDSIKIGIIAVNQEKLIRLPIKATGNLENGVSKISVLVSAYLNNPIPEFGFNLNTCSFSYQKEVAFSELNSDIDKDIPIVTSGSKEKFALIIGNEGYANEYTGLSKNFNIPFARHDAIAFRKYAYNVLGVKESNIIFLLDATRKEIYENILTLSDQVSKAKEGSELIFYYAGHGLSDTITLAPYIMPIDIPPSRVDEGISLDFLYKKLWESRSMKSMVILDASFNNGGRNIGLRGPSVKKINPRKEVISGNTVVFNAVSESYTANAYQEMRHGLFTYCLLKVIKESRGDIEYSKFDKLIKNSVSDKAHLLRKEQVPIALVSVAVSDIWQNWKLR